MIIKAETRIVDLTVGELQQLIMETVQKDNFRGARPEPQENDIVSIEVAMQITNLARQTIYGLVCHRKIPFIKKSKKLYFSRKRLIDWIQEK